MAHVVSLFNPGALCSTRSGTRACSCNASSTERSGLSRRAGMAARSGEIDGHGWSEPLS